MAILDCSIIEGSNTEHGVDVCNDEYEHTNEKQFSSGPLYGQKKDLKLTVECDDLQRANHSQTSESDGQQSAPLNIWRLNVQLEEIDQFNDIGVPSFARDIITARIGLNKVKSFVIKGHMIVNVIVGVYSLCNATQTIYIPLCQRSPIVQTTVTYCIRNSSNSFTDLERMEA